MHPSEKCGPKLANQSRINYLCRMVRQCGSFDMGFSSPTYI
jgi:hypothetical protein